MGKLDCSSIVRAGEGMSGKQEVLWMPLSASPRLMLKINGILQQSNRGKTANGTDL